MAAQAIRGGSICCAPAIESETLSRFVDWEGSQHLHPLWRWGGRFCSRYGANGKPGRSFTSSNADANGSGADSLTLLGGGSVILA